MEYPSVQVQLSRVLYVLKALKQASSSSCSSAIKALLEIETESDALLSKYLYFSTLFLNTSPTSKPSSKPFLDPAGAHEHFEDLDGDGGNKDKLVKLLTQFKDQAFQGFNRKLQDLVLKSKIQQRCPYGSSVNESNNTNFVNNELQLIQSKIFENLRSLDLRAK
ncbi:hypothetical protein KPL71_014967 [Citrus sinensis]|uniref:Uncharacterized protein n=1 Tax=Citrus sinensis TaxID=2711 RepID=A0ACB8KFF1_CITSI|nr:hypothetical protein KPL71_014967 [Citrus sinensis]